MASSASVDASPRFSGEYFSKGPQATAFTDLEVHELSKLYKHLTTAISSGKLPEKKFKIAKDALERLETRLKPINSLYVQASAVPELYRFRVDMFHSLIELYINRCPDSTILGLFKLRFQLTRLEVINSGIFNLSELLGPEFWDKSISCHPMMLPIETVPVPDTLKWNLLVNLRLSNCGIARLDKAMHLFPNLEQLDVSYNDIAHVIHLQDCPVLSVLNISHNRIRVLSNLSRVIKNISVLNLSNNKVESLDGLEYLELLERLDLSFNLIDDFHEVGHLVRLRVLSSVVLDGNLIALRKNYRLHVFTKFLDGTVLSGRELPLLDGEIVTDEEAYAMRGIMFRPSLRVTSSPAGDSLAVRSPSRLISSMSRAPSASVLTDLLMKAPAMSSDPMNRESFSGSVGNDRDDYRNLSVVELDKRFNAALSSWTAALRRQAELSEVTTDSPSAGRQVVEFRDPNELHFSAARSSPQIRSEQGWSSPSSQQQGKVRNRALREQIAKGMITASAVKRPVNDSIHQKRDSPASSIVRNAPMSGTSSANESLLKRTPALKSVSSPGHVGSAPVSPAGTPRANSRSVSFAIPVQDSSGIESAPPSVDSFSEKELLHYISRTVLPAAPGKARKRAKVAHVSDETFSRLPTLLAEYRMQVDQKAFVSRVSPTRSFFSGDTSRLSMSPLTGRLSSADKQTYDSSQSNDISTEKLSIKIERDRRKLELQQRLAKIQTTLDGIGESHAITSNISPAAPFPCTGVADLVEPVEGFAEDFNGDENAADASSVAEGESNDVSREEFKSTFKDPEESRAVSSMIGSTADIREDESSELAVAAESKETSNTETHLVKKLSTGHLVPKPVGADGPKSTLHMDLLDWEDDIDSNDISGVLYHDGRKSPENDEFEAPNSKVEVSRPVAISVITENLNDECEDGDDTSRDLVSDFILPLKSTASRDPEESSSSSIGVPSRSRVISIDRQVSKSTATNSSEAGPIFEEVQGLILLNEDSDDPYIRNSFTCRDTDSDYICGRINPPYVGNSDYADLLVAENLDLYMKEQVFNKDRPSYPSPYIVDPSFQSSDGEIRYISPSMYTERVMAVYREKVYIPPSNEEQAVTEDYSSFSELQATKNRPKRAESQDGIVETPFRILVATDMNLYVLKDLPRRSRLTLKPYVFDNAPIPELLYQHPLQCLRICTIFFGFQKCALNFSTSTATFAFPPDIDKGFTYIIITRDKTNTHRIISTLSPLANGARVVSDKSSRKVIITNKDSQLLDGVAEILKALKSKLLDVLHYQMLFQYRKKNKRAMFPRTLIISQEMILLCDEDLADTNVKITLVDSERLKNIFQVRTEEDPLQVTISFRSKAVFGPGRKWRLAFDSRAAVMKTKEELGRACADAGNTRMMVS